MLILRVASLSDYELLLNWVNSPEVRLNSFNQRMIDREEHRNWLINLINSKTNVIYIGSINGEDFGQVRFEEHNDIYEIDISVASAWRGAGLGTNLLFCAIEKLRESRSLIALKAQVKFGNVASYRLFKACGFEMVDSDGLKDMVEFTLRFDI
jgi:RimJ/RimL family protein N-acetyltransferase